MHPATCLARLWDGAGGAVEVDRDIAGEVAGKVLRSVGYECRHLDFDAGDDDDLMIGLRLVRTECIARPHASDLAALRDARWRAAIAPEVLESLAAIARWAVRLWRIDRRVGRSEPRRGARRAHAGVQRRAGRDAAVGLLRRGHAGFAGALGASGEVVGVARIDWGL